MEVLLEPVVLVAARTGGAVAVEADEVQRTRVDRVEGVTERVLPAELRGGAAARALVVVLYC